MRENVNPTIRNKRLNECLSILFKIKSSKREHVDIISIFYIKHLHSIICSLIQLVYSSNSNNLNDVFKKWLENDLFNEIDDAMLVKSLIMTQGIEKLIKVPTWFSKASGDLLTKCVLRPNSVVNLIKAILEEIDVNKTVESANDWKKCDLVARILTKCPKDLKIEEYMEIIAPQILRLFKSIDDTKPTKHLIRVSCSIYSIFAQYNPEMTDRYLTKQLIAPFNDHHGIIHKIEPDDLFKFFKLIHLVYCTVPNFYAIKQLHEKFFHLIFQIQISSLTKPTCTITNKICLDLIKTYINYIDDKKTKMNFLFKLLECSIISSNDDCPYCLSKQFSIICENVCSCDRLMLKLKDGDEDDSDQPTIKHVEERSISIINIIENLNDKTIQIEFLFELFIKLNTFISEQIRSSSINEKTGTHSSTDSSFLQLESKITKIEVQFNVKILYLTQISFYLENLDYDLLFKNNLKLVSLCQHILENIINLIVINEDNVIITEQIVCNEQEICAIILNILSLFTSGFIECSYEMKQELYKLLPCLEKIKELYVNNGELYNLADMLYISVGTYGAVKTTEQVKNKPKLIEEIPNFKPNSFEQVLYELNDPLLPVRGHALILLRQLIEKNDESCIKESTRVYQIIIDGLKSTDSYIYLAAINCLIAYTIRMNSKEESKNILKLLLDEFIKNNSKLNENDRLKVGEVIMKCVRNLNELLPFYGNDILNVFLISCKSTDELIRASSLSNIGETCKLLNYKIIDNLNEILNCVVSILQTENSINVRRSAMLVIKLLFEGLNKESFMDIIGGSLLNLYRTLKSIINDYRQDDVVRLHAQMAYEYLDELMKVYLFPKQNLVKEIKVLNP